MLSLVNYLAKLGKASSYFFFAGFVLSKTQYIAIPGVSLILGIAALGFNLVAYLLWLTATFFYPNHRKLENEWFAYDDFSEQHQTAAAIGVMATLLGIGAISLPVLLIPATWLIFSSNLIWSTGEYHKLKNPPPSDDVFSESFQSTYISYALTMSSIAFITATGTTLAFMFPPIAIHVFLVSSILCMGLGVLAADCWLNYTFGIHKPTPIVPSYTQMKTALGPSVAPQPSYTAPFQGEALVTKPVGTKVVPLEKQSTELSPTCNI